MADQEQVTEQVQDATNQEQPNQAVQETTEQKIAKAIEASIAPLKTQINGLNRKNTELEKEKRNAELARLPEKEQLEARLKSLDERDLKLADREKANERQSIVDRMAEKYKLTKAMSKRLIGDTEDSLELDALELSRFVAQEVLTKSTDTVNEKLSGKPPVGGTTKVLTEIQGLEQKMKEATNNGDMDTANGIYLTLAELKRKK